MSVENPASDPTSAAPVFLQDGGNMGARMRAHDWSSSPLGAPTTWPQSLRTTVSMMLNTLQPMFIAWGPELAFIYNDAYAPILGARHPTAMGARFRDVWADIWPDLEPLVEKALSGRAHWVEDMPLLMHRHGFPEQTYFTFTYSPLYDEAGQVAGMFCTCVESTGRVVAERRLREIADALAESQERLRIQRDRLYALFEEAPGFVAAMDGPEHRFSITNAAYRQLIGHRDVIGLSAREALPELEGQGFFEILDMVYSLGEPFRGSGMRAAIQQMPGSAPEARYVDLIYQPIRDETGAVTGILAQGSDVTAREELVHRQQLLLNELNHRVKNNMATVQSMAAQTARQAKDLPSFIRDFEGRLIALSRTHDVLTQSAWLGANLQDVLAQELGAFAERVVLDGPAVQLNSTQALAMGLITHELASNAVKYGALGGPEGMVSVVWRVEEGRLKLAWREQGGPQVKAPSRMGFGSRLISRLSRGDLHGEARMDYHPDGLRMELEAPVEG
ncbi:PAS domain-containing sensor histidine kinase [Phenylobacterium deserti]|uniref:histidine kinase n=1 Tax=Phenylobacterium deserti TaxID=1914756 RepID=A0A328ACW0_9CAUL|nr:HWE histidine kinase domain-containing protein [Phenylobacterium deserti]RAK52592.1 hypothetical protein DJ018_10305 [Phenylobacterium deserti]